MNFKRNLPGSGGLRTLASRQSDRRLESLARKTVRAESGRSLVALLGQLLPFFRRVAGSGRRTAKIALRKQRTDFIDGEHGLLRAEHIGAERVGLGPHYFLEVGGDVSHNGFCLRAVAAMQVDDQISNARKYVGRVEQLAFAFSERLWLRVQAITLSRQR